MDPVLVALVIGFLASLVAAYNMGWHAGHDTHHTEPPKSGGPGNLKPPRRPNLYV